MPSPTRRTTAAHNGKDTTHIVPNVLVVQLLQIVEEDLTILVKPRSGVCTGREGVVWSKGMRRWEERERR